MSNVKVTITNPDGNYALFRQHAAEIEEVERFDTVEGAKAAMLAGLGDAPVIRFVLDRAGRYEVSRVDWAGRESPSEPPAAAAVTVPDAAE